jgi:hypothetical protein
MCFWREGQRPSSTARKAIVTAKFAGTIRAVQPMLENYPKAGYICQGRKMKNNHAGGIMSSSSFAGSHVLIT